MTEPSTSLSFRKLVPDVLAGAGTFISIVGFACIAMPVSAVDWQPYLGLFADRREAVLLLAGGFSAMVVLNVAVFRHLCRAYAAPRRRARRRTFKPQGCRGA